ncbi:MAG TPA: DUF4082 domain-containing protein [Thermoanaerobaculales bacterium]|mgnify:CR=1 FL=1|nr:DUF4082 domain-containing protein [Thermoanaerobaculales bacterium]HPA81380.1 DUF4082 domain-containing protein [Thermoanaerobaculales bacterium]HQL30100.1 DUF4082 domain-containing protein [Thermoanaerobaculales bacterium]HQN94785.1 DUF4082 domain-containing protein [Thermoanaerobaculales bacterium]HQP43998.1 DUF4082 domain-containing protein [Thermoanaerobaculales bacterium]
MRRAFLVGVILALGASGAWAQAITGFSGGTPYSSYYSPSVAGDVVGFRFTVSSPLQVFDLGVWNADSVGGLDTPHQVGIWDGSQMLIASVTVDPATGTPLGQWTYNAITPVVLNPGETYTIGALYVAGGTDYYISGASSMTTAPEVTWVQSVYPAAGELGFVYPAGNTTSFGRFGPNFNFTIVPVELQSFSVE